MSAPTTYAVNVSSLSPSTSEQTLSQFFAFCGRLASIEHEGTHATVHFVKESAAKTALMLNGGTLDGSQISVTSDSVAAPSAAAAKAPATPVTAEHDEDVAQEDKPRSAVLAEYLAAGYHLSDQVIERGIQADQQYGISSRFLSFFNPLATKVSSAAQPHLEKATEKVKEVDEKQGLSVKASAAAIIGSKYYNAALASPFGSKVHAFYTTTSKQVLDVHEEALRIKEAKKASAGPSATSTSTSTEGQKTDIAGVESTTAPVANVGLASEKGASGTSTA